MLILLTKIMEIVNIYNISIYKYIPVLLVKNKSVSLLNKNLVYYIW